jgi:hypothetical protein
MFTHSTVSSMCAVSGVTAISQPSHYANIPLRHAANRPRRTANRGSSLCRAAKKCQEPKKRQPKKKAPLTKTSREPRSQPRFPTNDTPGNENAIRTRPFQVQEETNAYMLRTFLSCDSAFLLFPNVLLKELYKRFNEVFAGRYASYPSYIFNCRFNVRASTFQCFDSHAPGGLQ